MPFILIHLPNSSLDLFISHQTGNHFRMKAINIESKEELTIDNLTAGEIMAVIQRHETEKTIEKIDKRLNAKLIR